MSVLTTKEIMEIIPHRHPFLLIDTIEELVPGLRAVGKKCVTFDEPYFAGHFPAEPVMPPPPHQVASRLPTRMF